MIDDAAELIQIETLSSIKKSYVKKLKEAGIATAKKFAESAPEEICTILQISEKDAEEIIQNVENEILFIDTTTIEKYEKLKPRLLTGIAEINKHFLGGIEQESIIELIGPPRSGKTLWCTQLAVLAQIMYGKKSPEGRVVWYDADGTYNPNKVREIAYRFRLDPELAVQNIHHLDITEVDRLPASLEDITKLHSKHKIALVVIDSIQRLVRKLKPRLGLLKFLGSLRKLAVKTNIIFILTSNTRINISRTAGQIGEGRQSKSVEHFINIIAYLEILGDRHRRIFFQKLSHAPKTWDYFIDYGGIYGDRASRNAEKYRVRRYMKRLMS